MFANTWGIALSPKQSKITSLLCDQGFSAVLMGRWMKRIKFKVVFGVAKSWLCRIFFFSSFLPTAQLCVLPSVPVWTFPWWPWGPVHRVQVIGSLVGRTLFVLADLLHLFAPCAGDAEEEPVQVTGYNESNAYQLYFKTVHLRHVLSAV